MKRQRSRGRGKPMNHNPNRAYESAGPDIKVRGSAQTVFERYQQAGRDAMASGDRILAENYFQHAEHYLRLIKTIQPNFIPRSEFAISGMASENDEDGNDEENNNSDSENPEGENSEGENDENQNRDSRNWRDNRENRYNNNRRRPNNRERYRPERQNEGDAAPQEQEPIAASENNDANVEPSETSDAPKPRRTSSRVRSPYGARRTRPREEGDTSEEKSGFGDEAPAFLSVAPPAIDA